jgi:hypothetical protein
LIDRSGVIFLATSRKWSAKKEGQRKNLCPEKLFEELAGN